MSDLTQFFGGQGFDSASIPPDVVTPGDYTMLIEDASIKANKKQTGHYIEIQLQILDEGPFKGRKLWDRLNIDNPNPEAVKMAQRSLGALSVAAGIPVLSDTDMLLQKVVVACVKVKDDIDNNIRTYKAPVQAQASPAVAPTAAPAPTAVPVSAPAPVGALPAPAPVAPETTASVEAASLPAVAPVAVAPVTAPAVQAETQQPPPQQYAQAPAVAPQSPAEEPPAVTKAPWQR